MALGCNIKGGIMAKNESKQLEQIGQKCRAERMVSEYIRAVGLEQTEVTTVFTDPDTGKTRFVTKAEMLARDIWNKALEGDDEKLKLEYRKLLLNRIEGRPGAIIGETGAKQRNIPDKISEIGKNRLNQMVGENAEEN